MKVRPGTSATMHLARLTVTTGGSEAATLVMDAKPLPGGDPDMYASGNRGPSTC